MKNNRIKIVALLLALCLLVTLLTACTAKDKVFTKGEFSITLTDKFVEQQVEGQTVTYVSLSTLATVLKESKSLVGVNTLAEYTNLVLKNNSVNCPIVNKGDYLSFSYTRVVSGTEYYYYATTHQSDDDFWLIQFACKAKDQAKYAESFDKWAASVTFGK